MEDKNLTIIRNRGFSKKNIALAGHTPSNWVNGKLNAINEININIEL